MVDIIPGYDRIDEVRKLFSEYTAMLVSINPSFQLYLDIQHYGDEERNPSIKYQLPDGRLYLAVKDDETAGCVALRRLDDENGELKRLYVRPEFRGNASYGKDNRGCQRGRVSLYFPGYSSRA